MELLSKGFAIVKVDLFYESCCSALNFQCDYNLLQKQENSDEVHLSDMLEVDEEHDAMGHQYYTLEPRPIPYTSPNLTSHPATAKAKKAADSLNEEYLEVSNLHQSIRSKLTEFKQLTKQAHYAELAACFASLQKWSGKTPPLRLKCNEITDEPVRLEGGSEGVVSAVSSFNEVLDTCHQFLNERDLHLDRIRNKIRDLSKLAVMQQILDICSTFEEHASTNVNIYAMEIQSVLLDTKSAAKQSFK